MRITFFLFVILSSWRLFMTTNNEGVMAVNIVNNVGNVYNQEEHPKSSNRSSYDLLSKFFDEFESVANFFSSLLMEEEPTVTIVYINLNIYCSSNCTYFYTQEESIFPSQREMAVGKNKMFHSVWPGNNNQEMKNSKQRFDVRRFFQQQEYVDKPAITATVYSTVFASTIISNQISTIRCLGKF